MRKLRHFGQVLLRAGVLVQQLCGDRCTGQAQDTLHKETAETSAQNTTDSETTQVVSHHGLGTTLQTHHCCSASKDDRRKIAQADVLLRQGLLRGSLSRVRGPGWKLCSRDGGDSSRASRAVCSLDARLTSESVSDTCLILPSANVIC